MNRIIIVLLACFWMFLAYRAYSYGDSARAGFYLVLGGALTAYRLSRAR